MGEGEGERPDRLEENRKEESRIRGGSSMRKIKNRGGRRSNYFTLVLPNTEKSSLCSGKKRGGN